MTSKFRDISYPPTREYSSSSDRIPLEFYLQTFPVSKRIDLFLGYFSSNVFSVLAPAMARFIHNGGEMRIITNHYLNIDDNLNLIKNTNVHNQDYFDMISDDPVELRKSLDPNSIHFYDCLRYLMKDNRLKLQPVILKNGEMVHRKEMVLYDGIDSISTNGSINFTLNALTKNDESFIVDLPWDNEGEFGPKVRIKEREKRFQSVFNGENNDYELLDSSKIVTFIEEVSKHKTLDEIYIDSIKIHDLNKYNIIDNLIKQSEKEVLEISSLTDNYNLIPKFPYKSPHSYQIEAYENWKKNQCIGLFEMATGTGKTLTSILCLIKEFGDTSIQKNIIVVPGQELVNQWYEELKNSNFKNLFRWFSKNSNLVEDLKTIKNLKRGNELNIIITYSSFQSKRFRKIFKDNLKDFIVVFDEAHNMGAVGFMNNNKNIQYDKRIGLSATPLRDWDEEGSNEYIYDFFKISSPTFEFKMEQAIGKFLCEYNYYPYFSELNDEEWKEYKYWTSKLFVNPDEKKINTSAALKRQQVIDKNNSKNNTLISIVKHMVSKSDYKHTLIYCPKGEDDENQKRIIYRIGEIIKENFKGKINGQFFLGETKDRELLIEDFTNGHVDFMYAIKCLDEGVNIPVTKNAIFIASGKNKREYIQRRGRVLRKHKHKTHSNIFDIIVLPSLDTFKEDQNMSINLIKNEFSRILEFINISMNSNESIKMIDQKLIEYNLSYSLIKHKIQEDEKRYFVEKSD